jgi:hypothetical protein
MSTKLDRAPQCVNICLTRGDTQPFGFELEDENNVARNLAGYSYVLTVNTESDPTTNTNEVFNVVGSISGNVVSFNLNSSEADQLGVLFYDFQETDPSSAILTLAKGDIDWGQDITK